MSTTNANLEPGAKTDLVDQVGELESWDNVPSEPKPVKKAAAKKAAK